MNLDYLTIVLGIIIVSLIYYLTSRYLYNRFLSKKNGNNINGREIASEIIGGEELSLTLSQSQREYQNHIEIKSNTLILSPKIIERSSITALAIVSYELSISKMLVNKSFMLIIKELVNLIIIISSSIGSVLLLLSLILNEVSMYNLGAALFFVSIVFVLITFPLGIVSSIKSKKILERYSLVSSKDKVGVNILLIFLSLSSLNLLVSLMVIIIDYILDSLNLK